MGILGLLQYVRNCMKERHLSFYRGKTAAVDSYAWYPFHHSGCTRSSRDPVAGNLSSEDPTATGTSVTAYGESTKYRVRGSRSSWSSMEDLSLAKGGKKSLVKSRNSVI